MTHKITLEILQDGQDTKCKLEANFDNKGITYDDYRMMILNGIGELYNFYERDCLNIRIREKQ